MFTYNEFAYLSNDFEDLLGYESAYYIETMIKTADKIGRIRDWKLTTATIIIIIIKNFKLQ